VLERLAKDYELAATILDYRTLAKLKSTYLDKLPKMISEKTGRIHTNFSQAVTVTGRLASSDPNLQNIPIRTEEGRKIREAFIAAPHHFIVSADYSQVELRIMAHLSKDPGLLEAFAKGEDIHAKTASEIFGVPLNEVTPLQRRYAKTINFGLIYGMSPYGLAQQLGIDREEAKAYIDRYFTRYPKVAEYMERSRMVAREKGYVETIFGRRVYVPEIHSESPARRNAAERQAINGPMQGSAADIIKLAMIDVHQALQDKKATLSCKYTTSWYLKRMKANWTSCGSTCQPSCAKLPGLTYPWKLRLALGTIGVRPIRAYLMALAQAVWNALL